MHSDGDRQRRRRPVAGDDPDRAALRERVRCTCVVQRGVGAGAEDVQEIGRAHV